MGNSEKLFPRFIDNHFNGLVERHHEEFCRERYQLEFTFDLEFAPEDPGLGESSSASVFTAIQEQLGLKLDSARVPAEILVIDRRKNRRKIKLLRAQGGFLHADQPHTS